MKLLILGGGVFLGRAVLDAALARGHAVTVFNRGRSRTEWPAAVEVIHGDRRTDLSRIAGRGFDAVIDNCGYVPDDLRASTAACRAAGTYLFVSSISAYAAFDHAPLHEADALADPAGIATDDRDPAHYGAQKAACEMIVQEAFGARALIVRPGLIVGPGDPTGRFSHWPWRVAEGGEMLVPAAPADAPLQFIDVRDLGTWMLDPIEQGRFGIFNATGPTGLAPCTWTTLLAECMAAAAARGLATAAAVPVDEAFLIEQKIEPWGELPLWLPASDASHAGFMHADVSRAEAAGLATRPLRETIEAILDEGVPDASYRRRQGKLTREREAALIGLWRGR